MTSNPRPRRYDGVRGRNPERVAERARRRRRRGLPGRRGLRRRRRRALRVGRVGQRALEVAEHDRGLEVAGDRGRGTSGAGRQDGRVPEDGVADRRDRHLPQRRRRRADGAGRRRRRGGTDGDAARPSRAGAPVARRRPRDVARHDRDHQDRAGHGQHPLRAGRIAVPPRVSASLDRASRLPRLLRGHDLAGPSDVGGDLPDERLDRVEPLLTPRRAPRTPPSSPRRGCRRRSRAGTPPGAGARRRTSGSCRR